MSFHKLVIFLIFTFCSFSTLADWIPFKFSNNQITIGVEINGQPVQAILDSGSNINMISSSFVSQHGQNFKKTRKIRVQGVNGSSYVQLYNNVPVKMFGGDFDLDGVAVGNIGEATLLLGSTFFNNAILQIDFPNSRLKIFPKSAVDMDKYANVPMRRSRSSSLPAIQVEINSKKVWLTFDTGNSGAIYLKRSLAVAQGWLTDETDIKKSRVQGISRIANVDVFTVNSLKIGPYELDNVDVLTPSAGERTNVGESKRETSIGNNSRISRGIKPKGIIGFDIFKHFVVTVDFTDYQLHIVAS
ncbi:MAG: retropepsin-like domain-containing protein [Colwellia sp.]|nr:retropepsin-like domain-containing protein [Colwellia sp.]